MPTAAVIHNPVSGTGRGPGLIAAAAAALSQAGYRVLDSRPSVPDGGAAPAAAELADEVDLLVVVGGDGSLREAVTGLGAAIDRVTVGFVPLGNANVVARELGIPLDAAGALRVLAEGKPRALDVGRIDDDVFLAMVGVGWDALCVRMLGRARRTRLGAAVYRTWADGLYGVAGVTALARPFPPPMQVSVDAVPLDDACYTLVASNCRIYGKDWRMTPDADPTDGLLDFQACRRWAPPLTLLHLLAAARRRPAPGFVSSYGKAQRLSVRSERPLPVQIDGDWYGYRTQLELELRPRALRVLAPPA